MSEQARAFQLSQQIDRLMAGEPITDGDALLEVADLLATADIQPGAEAVARFEGRLDEWFGSGASPAIPKRSPVLIIAAVLIIVLVAIAIGILIINQANPPILPSPTATATTSPTNSATFTVMPSPAPTETTAVPPISSVTIPPSPTLTASPDPTDTPAVAATPSLTPTTLLETATPVGAASLTTTPVGTRSATPSPIPYTNVIVEGPIEEVNATIDVIVVRGQRIRLRSDDPIRTRIKVGDWIRAGGNIEREGGQIIIVAVVVVIIDSPSVVITPDSGRGGMGDRDDDD